MDKFFWIAVNKSYIKYLNKFDEKVQYNAIYDYKDKPYIGIIMKKDDINYFLPISSVKPHKRQKFERMYETKDFKKLIYQDRLIAVLNLNNSIPIPKKLYKKITFDNLSRLREFKDNVEKNKYYNFLKIEKKLIEKNKNEIIKDFDYLYHKKRTQPENKFAKRCCNFELLENIALKLNTFIDNINQNWKLIKEKNNKILMKSTSNIFAEYDNNEVDKINNNIIGLNSEKILEKVLRNEKKISDFNFMENIKALKKWNISITKNEA